MKKVIRQTNFKEDKIYTAIRQMYGYGEEGDELVDWLMENLKG